MALEELRLGPKQSDEDKRIALEELERKINQIVRELNSLLEALENESG